MSLTKVPKKDFMKKSSFAVLFLAVGFLLARQWPMPRVRQEPARPKRLPAAPATLAAPFDEPDQMDQERQIQSSSEHDKNLLLTEHLHEKGILAANLDVTSACSVFKHLSDCLASLHASHNVGLDFNCVRADVTGVQTNADISPARAQSAIKQSACRKR